MASDEDTEAFIIIVIAVVLFIGWVTGLSLLFPTMPKANWYFFAVAIAIYVYFGVDHRHLENKHYITVIGTISIISIIYLTNTMPEMKKNLFILTLGGVWVGATIGLIILATVENYLWLKCRIETKNHVRYQNRQQQEFAEEFEGQDADFAYDETKFQAETRPTNPAPRGFEQRRKEDAKLWAVIDDPNATEGESLAALKAIKRRQSKASARKQITHR
jgi:hypothetical protein